MNHLTTNWYCDRCGDVVSSGQVHVCSAAWADSIETTIGTYCAKCGRRIWSGSHDCVCDSTNASCDATFLWWPDHETLRKIVDRLDRIIEILEGDRHGTIA